MVICCCYLLGYIFKTAIIAERGEGPNADSSTFDRANVEKYDYS